MKLPRIAVTMGDPAGIGPEICLRLLANAEVTRVCTPMVFGSAGVLRRVAEKLALPFDASGVIDLAGIAAEEIIPGQIDARCGEAAYRYVVAAIDAALAGEFDAIATAPLHKEALHAAGHDFPGHTEIFATRMRAERSCMMLTAPEITCSLVTVHVGLGEVAALLTTERIREVIDLTADAMRRMRGREPRLAVCGLNPHAGEGGLFGQREEERIITPAVVAARAAGLDIEGPLPPDTAFLPERRARTDAYVCMYHDQGLIPLKALAFDSAINTTLGLPIVRTSVDHGTAFDIAWQGKANPASLYEAVRLAARLSANFVRLSLLVGGALVWCSCASMPERPGELSPATERSGEARFNPGAGHGEALYLTLRGPQGESWRFLVDTGAPDTMLDRSLAPKLGPALGSEVANYGWFGARKVTAFAAPSLFLGGMRLRTGDRVLTDDFSRLFPRRHVMGILGMDCLRNYCVQLDFGAGRIRFLESAAAAGGDLGQSFRLGTSGGAIYVSGDLLGAGAADFQIDTGCTIDAVMESRLFQHALRQQTPLQSTRFRSPAGRPVQESTFAQGTFAGQAYTRLIVDGADDNLLGLRFLARHVVILDFPRHTLYLRSR